MLCFAIKRPTVKEPIIVPADAKSDLTEYAERENPNSSVIGRVNTPALEIADYTSA